MCAPVASEQAETRGFSPQLKGHIQREGKDEEKGQPDTRVDEQMKIKC